MTTELENFLNDAEVRTQLGICGCFAFGGGKWFFKASHNMLEIWQKNTTRGWKGSDAREGKINIISGEGRELDVELGPL